MPFFTQKRIGVSRSTHRESFDPFTAAASTLFRILNRFCLICRSASWPERSSSWTRPTGRTRAHLRSGTTRTELSCRAAGSLHLMNQNKGCHAQQRKAALTSPATSRALWKQLRTRKMQKSVCKTLLYCTINKQNRKKAVQFAVVFSYVLPLLALLPYKRHAAVC